MSKTALCVYCFRDFNETLKPTLDHILPLSRDGRHENSNLQLLCLSCNSSKGDRTHEESLPNEAEVEVKVR